MTKIERIEEMEKQLVALKAEVEKEDRFELEYENGNTFFLGSFKISGSCRADDRNSLQHGRFRKTVIGADLSFRRNKRSNRLEALVEQCGGIKEFILGGGDNYYIYFSHNGKYDVGSDIQTFEPEKVYMSKGTAQKVCEILNSGRYKLE